MSKKKPKPSRPRHADAAVIDRLGGPTKVAQRLGWTNPGAIARVSNWKSRGIPEVLRLRRTDVFGPAPKERRAG